MKNLERKLVLGSAAALMAVGGIAPAFAEEVVTTGNTIDTTKKGSITLYKLQSTNGASKDGTGLEQAHDEKGIAGVKFNIVKVGELAQIDTNEDATETQAGVYYTLTDAFKEKLAAIGVTATADVTKDGVEYFTAETVNAALKAANQSTTSADDTGADIANEQLISFAKTSADKIEMDATAEDGKTSKGDLDLGLYLVAEVESPNLSGDGESQSVAKAARPFLVSLPMTNIATITNGDESYDPGTVWQYDVTAYPKNEMISIRKDIIADGNDTADGAESNSLVQTTNKNVGDYVNFLLTLDLPALQDKTNEVDDSNALRKYVIKDTMSEGLTLDDTSAENFKVSFGVSAWNDAENNKALTYGDDYTVELDSDTNIVTVTMTEAGLAKMSEVTADSKVYVNYKARLNADAVKDDTGAIKVEDNKFTLTYGTKTSRDYEFKSNEDIRVYTYEIDIAKKFSHTVSDEDMKAVSFSIKGLKDDGSGDYEQVKFIKEADGVYHKYDGKEVAADSAEIVEEVHCAAGGKLILKGLDARMYVVTEENTVKGYNLMRDTISVNFADNYKQDGKVDSAKLASGTYSEDSAIAIANEDLDKGVVSFTIKNNETIEALHTGGSGWTRALAAMGVTAIVAGGAMFVFRKRKEEE